MNMKWPEITADTPIEEVQRIHKQIWDFVIEYGRKPDAPYNSNCVCCEYALKLKSTIGSYEQHACSFCPAKWSGEVCFDKKSEYIKFSIARSHSYFKSDLAEAAKKVRDIPFKSFEEITSLIVGGNSENKKGDQFNGAVQEEGQEK